MGGGLGLRRVSRSGVPGASSAGLPAISSLTLLFFQRVFKVFFCSFCQFVFLGLPVSKIIQSLPEAQV